MTDLRLHVIPLGNQEIDGTGVPVHRYEVTPLEFAEVLDKVNPFFAPAGIRFVFDPEVDWRPMLDTELNSDGPAMRQRGNAMAAGIPGKVLCLLRWGPDPATPTGNGNAYPPPGAGATPRNMFDVTQDYVALPNQYGPNEPFLNLGNGTFLAHELGHYMGLYHTFPGWSDLFGPVYAGQRPATVAAAQQTLVNYIMANGATIAALDGDGLQDTPPDPSPILFAAVGSGLLRQSHRQRRRNLERQSGVVRPDPRHQQPHELLRAMRRRNPCLQRAAERPHAADTPTPGPTPSHGIPVLSGLPRSPRRPVPALLQFLGQSRVLAGQPLFRLS